jgi:hypothetical protein
VARGNGAAASPPITAAFAPPPTLSRGAGAAISDGMMQQKRQAATKERSGTTGQKRGVVRPDEREEWYNRTKERSGTTGRKRGVVQPDKREEWYDQTKDHIMLRTQYDLQIAIIYKYVLCVCVNKKFVRGGGYEKKGRHEHKHTKLG